MELTCLYPGELAKKIKNYDLREMRRSAFSGIALTSIGMYQLRFYCCAIQ